ncbi:MAG: pantetheine-phosphate adenylyltransferase [Kiritimatiellaeota bacterium]|nr:pantetheine-phosphate adenylyltransferase [Kiritimatiellota bacterium]
MELTHDTAVYPGTFDPLTLGHLDLILRSSHVFKRVVVAVAATSSKAGTMFRLDERMAMAREAVAEAGITGVEVEPLDGLLVDYCERRGIGLVVRGLRAYSDFEYEFQMALTNRQLNPRVETLFLMPNEEHSYITASMVREVARFGGRVGDFVPASVARRVAEWRKAGGQ